MNGLRGTLLSDGTSDRALLPVIRWLLEVLGSPGPRLQHPNPYLFPPEARSLFERAVAAVDLDPCDVLFVHRDAEGVSHAERKGEICKALQSAFSLVPFVCVVPVRMTEAWLLFDAVAIRTAAGNPGGTTPLNLPDPRQAESIADPKQVLRTALCEASDLTGRRLRRFRRELARTSFRVADLIDDFGPIRVLPAFGEFERELRMVLRALEERGPVG